MQHKLITVSDEVLAEIGVLQKSAQSDVTRSATKYLVFAIGIFGITVAPFGLPVAAISAAPMIYIAFKKAAQSGSGAAYLKATGNFAPLLNERQLLKLTNLTSKEVVLRQLVEALEDGKYLSHAALDYLECCGVDTDPPDLRTELTKLDQRLADQAKPTIDVTPKPADTTTAPLSLLDDDGTTPAPQGSEGVAAISLIDAIALDPKSLLIAAPTRVGKGGLAAGAIRATQALVKSGKHPTIKTIRFWWLTPKQFRNEDWYWATCDKFHNPDLDGPGKVAAVKSIYQFIVEYGELERSPENPTVLGLDEFSRLMSLSAGVKMCQVDPVLFAGDNRGFDVWLVDRAIHSASMLQASGFWVWVVLPANTVGGQRFSKGDADSFNVLTLAAPANMSFADGSAAAFAAPEISADHPVFQRGYAAGYRKRDRLWYSVPDFGAVINRRTAAEPVEMTNRWLSPLPVESILTLDNLFSELEAEPPTAAIATATKLEESKPLKDYFRIFRYRPMLIWGPQGSGKSTVARELVRLKQADGQQVSVLNPHGSSVEWDGAAVVGAGKDYKAIHAYLREYLEENKTRYEAFRDSGLTEQLYLERLVEQGKVLSPICEEMSSWCHNLSRGVLSAFSLCCLTESRKVLMPPVFVAHDRALDFIGLKRGANLKESGLVELELLAPEQDPETKLLKSCGRGILRIPGSEPFPVHFDNFDAEAAKKAEAQPLTESALTTALPSIVDVAEPEPETEPIDENGLLIVEYLQIQPLCPTYSSAIERLGTKLQRRGLIEKRTVEHLKGWLTDNNLPHPGSEATPVVPVAEPLPLRRKK